MQAHLSLLDEQTMSFAAVEVLNTVDDSIVLPFIEVELYPYPISGREISGSDKFDLGHPSATWFLCRFGLFLQFFLISSPTVHSFDLSRSRKLKNGR